MKVPGSVRRPFIILFLASSCLPALAGQEVARIPFVEAPQGTPALGGGIRFGSNPYRGGHAIVDVVPLYLYEGKYLFSHGTSFGVHAYRNDHFRFDVFARYRFQRLDPEGDAFDDDYLQGLDEREQTVDAGIAFGLSGRWGEVKLDWLADALDRHNGQEVELSYRYRFDLDPLVLSPFVTVSWQDEDLTGYYFGIDPPEARSGRPVYTPGEAYNFGLGLNTSYAVSERFDVFANFGVEVFDDDIKDSPLIEDQAAVAAFVGGSFMFGNLEKAETPDPDREQEWSWRLNYGYQAEGNIVGEIDHGNVSRSTKADTNIAGLTLGKLLIDGPRVDYYARGAVYRHLEDDLQDDFFSFTGYIMAMGNGYLPWTEKTSFRWGFGFGFSYAQSVPMAERIQQAERDGETAQFLNYLEMTFDFPIHPRNKSRFMGNCYSGFTVVHRSGIFSTADILGNVFGGSDWITVHLECFH